MRKSKIATFLLTGIVLLGSMFDISAQAGIKTSVSEPITESKELNSTAWSFLGDITTKDNKVIISSETSDADTRFISKTFAKKSEEVTDMVKVDSTLKLTSLTQNTSFIFAFGLSNIEACSGEDGNVEIVISNRGGLSMSVLAYKDGEQIQVMQNKSMGTSVNREFSLTASINNKGVIAVSVNGSQICSEQLPVSGEGRFGVLQTGACGAEISKLNLVCNDYDRPENTEIFEDFEKGEFNINQLRSRIIGVGMAPASFTIKDYEGSKVMMFQNTAQAYLGTMHSYSNFEISFDIPYWPAEDICDEQGNVVTMKGDSICIGFGESTAAPRTATYAEDMDMIRLYKTSAVSDLRKLFDVTYEVAGMPKETDPYGYSVKFTLIDGKGELQVKPLNGEAYTTVATAEYSVQQTGYVNIWTTNGGTVAIDNLKIVNKDINPNTVTVEYETSILSNPDYDITQENTELVFREQKEDSGFQWKENMGAVTIMCVTGAGILAIIGFIIGNLMKQKKLQGGKTDEAV